MKKIILSLVLVFGMMFGGNVYGYSLEEWEKTIIELKKELKSAGYIFKDNFFEYYDNDILKISKTFDIYINSKLKYNISVNEDWISLDFIKIRSDNSIKNLRVFSNKDYPIGHILYYFDDYKDKSQIINWVVNNIELWHNDTIKIFPWKKRKYYLNIRYKWGDSQWFWNYNDNLYNKYYIKNNCFWLKENKKEYKLTKEDRYKCINNSIIEHYKDSNIKIKIKNSPNFIKIKKNENWLDYFEIDLENNDYDNIWTYWLEFEVFFNWQNNWFTKKIAINVLKPIILVVWELWPDWGTIFNNWKDISINIKKWLLTKKYKIAYISNKEWLSTVEFWDDLPEDKDWNIIDYYFNFKSPPRTILYKNYLEQNKYWTTIWDNLDNIDVKNYNKCILNKNKTDKQKYDCFKIYMWFTKIKDKKINFETNSKINLKSKFTKQLIISKLKLKNTKFEKVIPKFEKIVPKISDKKLLEIDVKIWKFSEKIRSNEKYKDILDYLEAKIKLEIIKRDIK
jgi:hypothetical protein